MDSPGLELRPQRIFSTVTLKLGKRMVICQCGLPWALASFLRSKASMAITSGDPVHKMCWRVQRVDPNLSQLCRDSASSKLRIGLGVLLIAMGAPARSGGKKGLGGTILQAELV